MLTPYVVVDSGDRTWLGSAHAVRDITDRDAATGSALKAVWGSSQDKAESPSAAAERLDRGSLVDEEEVKRARAVFCAGAGVAAGGFQAGVAKELGDDDEVGPAADERVPQDVGGRVVVEARGSGQARDHVVGAFGAQALLALVENEGRSDLSTGPSGAFVEPAGERGA